MKYSKDIIYILIAIIALGLLFYVSKKENLEGEPLPQTKPVVKKDSRVVKKKGLNNFAKKLIGIRVDK